MLEKSKEGRMTKKKEQECGLGGRHRVLMVD